MTIVWYDYLQRVRSYRFLIIICASLAIASTFLPGPDDSYHTIRIGDYVGNNNSAWVAYVTAIMASAFVSWIGYYLINSSIQIDHDTRVGIIVAASRITNYQYLLSKFLANIVILFTIVILVLVVSLTQFFAYGAEYPFEFSHFLWAYLSIPIPSIFLVSAIAVFLEVCFINKSLIQNALYFFAFVLMIIPGSQALTILDPFGISYPTGEMISQVNMLTGQLEEYSLNIGYTIGHTTTEYFDLASIPLSPLFIMGRLLWIVVGMLIIYIISRFFHRFEFQGSKKAPILEEADKERATSHSGLDITQLPQIVQSASISAIYKAELLMMVRSGKKWLWLINFIGMILLVVVPLEFAHTIILPVLWFLQVHRWADLITKEQH